MCSADTDPAAAVVLIGLGAVGMGYDIDLEPAAYALTHASAIEVDPRFALVAGVDTDEARCARFFQRFATPAFREIEDAPSDCDVVVIATPAHTHVDVLRRVFDCMAPRLVLMEKPMGANVKEATAIRDMARDANVELLVNYHRAADPRVVAVAQSLRDADIPRPYAGVGWYSKGLVNNASHLVALLMQWLGPVRRVEAIGSGDVGAAGPEPAFRLCFNGCDVEVLVVRHQSFSRFSVELVGDAGLLELGGVPETVSLRPVVADPVTPGYRTLGEPAPLGPYVNPHQTFACVYDELVSALAGMPNSLWTANEALEVQEILDIVITLT